MGQWVEESRVTNITEFEFECRYLEDIWSKHIEDVSKHFELVKIEIVKENKEHLNLYKGKACKNNMESSSLYTICVCTTQWAVHFSLQLIIFVLKMH